MTNQLLEHLRSKFTTATVNDMAQTLSESPASAQKAVDSLLPAVTAGVVNRINQSDGEGLIFNLLNNAKFDTENLEQLIETADQRRKAAESGTEFLTRLHGSQVNQLAQETAAYSGVKPASAGTMIGLVTSVLMGYLRNQIRTKNLTGAQLTPLLRGESDGLREAIPAALATAVAWLPTLGQTRVTTTSVPVTPVTATTTTTTTPVRPVVEDNKGSGWWRWLLLALALIGLFLLLTKMCNRDKTETAAVVTTDSTQNTTETVATDTVGNAGAAASGPEVRVGVDLPGGRKLNVQENSFNFQLAKFLATKGGQVPKIFTFDNLTFDTNSARITAEARPNVDDLIQIMQAYPSLNIRIEGNTDSTGPDALNDPLSADRAEAVKDALIKAGIESSRVTTRERGERKPVASNETEAGREKNRRIDVVITKL